MIDNPFRHWLSNKTGFLNTFYLKLGLSPNHITLAGLFLACCSAFFCAYGFSYLSIFIWWLGRLLDGTDGIYARKTKQTSLFGAYLDILCDMASYSVMIVGFSFLFPELKTIWLLTLGLYVLCVTSALALGALEKEVKTPSRDNRGLRLGAGLAEGGETGIAYTLFLLFPSSVYELSLFWIFILLVTVLSRTFLAKKLLMSS